MVGNRIEMNGAWYLSAERAASLLHTDAHEIASRKDFQETGHFIIFDGVHFYSELYCQQLVAQKHPS